MAPHFCFDVLVSCMCCFSMSQKLSYPVLNLILNPNWCFFFSFFTKYICLKAMYCVIQHFLASLFVKSCISTQVFMKLFLKLLTTVPECMTEYMVPGLLESSGHTFKTHSKFLLRFPPYRPVKGSGCLHTTMINIWDTHTQKHTLVSLSLRGLDTDFYSFFQFLHSLTQTLTLNPTLTTVCRALTLTSIHTLQLNSSLHPKIER